MASNSYRGGSSFYNGDAAPYRSREGLSTRPAAASDEIQLQIDPMQGDLDDQIVGLHGQVKRLRNIAQEIGTEAKSQQDFLDQLQMTLIKAQAGVKNNCICGRKYPENECFPTSCWPVTKEKKQE
ncbi:Bet1-like protein, partial [Cucurbita argyrosperma subsp. sororia]